MSNPARAGPYSLLARAAFESSKGWKGFVMHYSWLQIKQPRNGFVIQNVGHCCARRDAAPVKLVSPHRLRKRAISLEQWSPLAAEAERLRLRIYRRNWIVSDRQDLGYEISEMRRCWEHGLIRAYIAMREIVRDQLHLMGGLAAVW